MNSTTDMGSARAGSMEYDLVALARVLRKRKWYFLGAFLSVVATGALITVNTTPIYQAQSSLFVGQRQVSVAQLQQGVQLTALSEQLLKSYAEILKSRSIAQSAVADGSVDVGVGQIRSGLEARPILETQVITLTYRGDDPAVVARVVNGVAKAFVSEIGELEADQPGQQAAVRVSIIDPAVAPGQPIAPNPVRNVALAVILGLLAGGALAFVVDRLDQSVRTREELEQAGVTVLGSVPELETEGEEVYIERDIQGPGGEAFRKLRTAIGFLSIEEPAKTILVTSSTPQEGKTTVALNLATAYALGGFRTLLVEADLRRPSLHRVFGMYGTRGLTTALVGSIPLEEAVINTEIRNLAVLLAGAIPPNPLELLGSQQMSGVLNRLRSSFDVVVVDSPPMVPVADPAALASLCDGVVLVARAGKTDRRRLSDSIQIVRRAGGRLLGVALNFVRAVDSREDYEYYYYGYRSSADGTTRRERVS